ncbi:MAG TPA: ABC transporter permease [Candidatus Eremiobacteraeota bacterium]|nr:ABC transporter permease [Candidatus Eremiobacteraeota bacterium]
MKFFEGIGKAVLDTLELIGGLISLLCSTLLFLIRGAINFVLTIEQMSILGVDSLLIILLTTSFAGMVMAYQLALQALIYGLEGFVGGGVVLTMARELAPLLTAVVMAGRVGSAITAQIASMKVTEQIDALRSLGTNPVRYLVVPRFLACLLMTPLLTMFSVVGGTAGGYFVATSQGINPYIYMDSIKTFFKVSDLTGGLIKALVFGATVAIVGCYIGFTTEGGAAGVGRSTTNSVVISTVLIFLFNFPLTVVIFGNTGIK